MSDKLSILIVGRNGGIVRILERLINQHEGWSGVAVVEDEEAMQRFDQHTFDMVLFSSGISEEEDRALRQYFLSKNPNCILLQHYGGGSGLLYNEIQFELDRRGLRKTG